MSRLISSFLVLACASIAHGAVISVDGNLSDWGIKVHTNGQTSTGMPGGTDYTGPIPGSYAIEDTGDGAPHSGQLGPGDLYGGQDYDVEFLGAIVEGNVLKIAIMSGQRQDNGLNFYSPGDIMIEYGSITYGIEVGGGAGGSATSGSLGLGSPGSYYVLNGDGTTNHVDPTIGTAGSIWLNPTFVSGVGSPPLTQISQTAGGTAHGVVDSFAFTWDNTADGLQHSYIEVGISLDKLQPGGVATITWSPSCANDTLSVMLDLHSNETTPTPEPLTVAMWSAFAFGGIFLHRRARRN